MGAIIAGMSSGAATVQFAKGHLAKVGEMVRCDYLGCCDTMCEHSKPHPKFAACGTCSFDLNATCISVEGR